MGGLLGAKGYDGPALKLLGGGLPHPPLPAPMIGQKNPDRTRATLSKQKPRHPVRKVNTMSTRFKKRIGSWRNKFCLGANYFHQTLTPLRKDGELVSVESETYNFKING